MRHIRRIGWKEARGDAMLLAGRNQGVHGIQEHWMLELRGNAQRYSQIIVANPRDVESRRSHDGVEILKGFWSLDDRNDNGLLVCLLEVRSAAGMEIVMCQPERHPTAAARSVF